MKKIFYKTMLILFFTLTFVKNSVYAKNLPIMQSTNIGIYNADTMELLYGENEKEKISVASITKVMTAVVCVDNIKDLNKEIVIDYDVISSNLDPELAIAGIYNNQIITYYDLLATMLVPSGADSAMYLASTVCENYDTFISKMNEKAKEIGMNNTSFSNPTGLDDENNYSTIEDVVKLINYAIQNNTLKEIMSMDSYTTSDGNLKVRSTIDKAAKRYGMTLDYIIGGKTGTTGDAGQCLASFSLDDNTLLICVVTGSSMYSSKPNNIIDSESLYEYISELYSLKPIVKINDELVKVNTICCKQDNITFYSDEEVLKYISEFNKEKLNIIYDGVDEIEYGTKVGEKIGKVDIYYGNVYLKSIDLILKEKLQFSLKKWIILNKTGIIIISGIIIIFVTLIVTLKRRRK